MKSPNESGRKNEASWSENKGMWRIDVQKEGKRKSFYSSVPGRKGKIEAERKADEWLDDGGSDNPRLELLWADFLAETKRTTGTGNYTKIEQFGRLYLLPRLKLRRIQSITVQDWQDCITAAYECGAHGKGLAKKSLRNIRDAIMVFHSYAKRRRIKIESPDGIVIPRDAPVGERNILQPDQLKILFSRDWIMNRGKMVPCFFIHAWRFIVLTGLRRGELCGIRNDDIAAGILSIKRSINASLEITNGKNENARRYIALSPRMQEVLDAQRTSLKNRGIISPWLFPDEHGDPLNPNHLSATWGSYRKQHGLQSNIHELRHTIMSIVKSDVPEDLLKLVVGHSDKMDTGIYKHAVDGDAEHASQLIYDVFSRLLTPS